MWYSTENTTIHNKKNKLKESQCGNYIGRDIYSGSLPSLKNREKFDGDLHKRRNGGGRTSDLPEYIPLYIGK